MAWACSGDASHCLCFRELSADVGKGWNNRTDGHNMTCRVVTKFVAKAMASIDIPRLSGFGPTYGNCF